MRACKARLHVIIGVVVLLKRHRRQLQAGQGKGSIEEGRHARGALGELSRFSERLRATWVGGFRKLAAAGSSRAATRSSSAALYRASPAPLKGQWSGVGTAEPKSGLSEGGRPHLATRRQVLERTPQPVNEIVDHLQQTSRSQKEHYQTVLL